MLKNIYLSIGLLSILFAQGPYPLSFNPSQFEFSVENGYDRVRGIEMSAITDTGAPKLSVKSPNFIPPNGKEKHPLDLPVYSINAQENLSPGGPVSAKSMPVVTNDTDRKIKNDILSRSVEEFLIDQNIGFTNARGDQYAPSVAFDGTNYLIVWADGRNVPTDTTRPKFFDIYGVRVTPAGELLDPSNILISHTRITGEGPKLDVAFDGVNYLVVWEDYNAITSYDIIGTRVTTDGVVLDPNGIVISSAPGEQRVPSITFTGQNYFVVWQDNRNFIDRNIYGARVTTTGLVLDPDGIIISSVTGDQYAPCVATDGINYFVTWADNRVGEAFDIYGARVNQSGVVLDPNGIPISTVWSDQGNPSVVYGGTYYFVVWQDARNPNSKSDIYGARVSPTGTVIDPDGIVISLAPRFQLSPAVAFDGQHYFVVWQDRRAGGLLTDDIYGARVDQSGIVLDPEGIPINTLQRQQARPAIAFNGSNYLVVYDDFRELNVHRDIYGSRVSQSGSVLDPEGILLSQQIYTQALSSSSYGGTNFFVVYEDFRNKGNHDIYGTRISLAGEILDPTDIPIITEQYIQVHPDVAFDGNNYLVVWNDGRREYYRDIYGARVDRNGNVLDPGGIPIGGTPWLFDRPSVVFGGTNYFVVWETPDSPLGVYGAIIGARVTPDGIVLDPNGIVIGYLLGTQFFTPDVAFDGTNYFVVWARRIGSETDIYGKRVTQDGAVIDPDPGIPISTKPYSTQQFPAIAFDGNIYFVVWEDARNDVNYDIYGARVSPDGIVLDPDGIPVAIQPGAQIRPKVSFNGSQFVVVWEDVNSGDLTGTKVSSDCTVGPIFAVSTAPALQYEPAICHGPEDLMLVTFTGWVPEFENYRIWGKFIGEHTLWTDDPLALAYNGNRHLVREPNTERLHLVYTDRGKVTYRFSSNGGTDWTLPFIIGDGKFPAITLSSDNLPSVCWIDEPGGLWYRRQTAPGVWGDVYRLYYPVSPLDPFVNSPPAIVIVPSNPDEVHILITRTGRIQMNGVAHTVEDCIFPITNPEMLVFELIEQGVGGMYPLLRSHPSIARSPNNLLHAVWQRADTICYATRLPGQSWQNWGPRFGNEGIQSAHPFVETYGDMVYVVWQKKTGFWGYKEVYKGWRQIPFDFSWDNFSLTPDFPSQMPVNASGMFTVYAEMPTPIPNHLYEIYYKVHPDDIPYNISLTSDTRSYYPHSVARFFATRTYLYTAWLEGDGVPYEIRFKKIQHIPMEFAYLISNNGYETPSPYLVARDSFISTWQIPVYVGYQTITYQFPLELGYRYKMKVIAYHESSGQWREWVKIDNKWRHQIRYNAYEPETLELWIPPAFYQDGKIEVVFDKISGTFTTAGPIYVYQYEYEEGTTELASGPMAQEGRPLNSSAITIFPNPFTERLDIRYQIRDNRSSHTSYQSSVNIKIYDVAGRLIKRFNYPTIQPSNQLVWDGRDESDRAVSPGVYFITIENTATKETFCHKVIKVE